MEETRARLRELGWRWHELETLWDVDRPDDYERLVASGLLEPQAPARLKRAFEFPCETGSYPPHRRRRPDFLAISRYLGKNSASFLPGASTSIKIPACQTFPASLSSAARRRSFRLSWYFDPRIYEIEKRVFFDHGPGLRRPRAHGARTWATTRRWNGSATRRRSCATTQRHRAPVQHLPPPPGGDAARAAAPRATSCARCTAGPTRSTGGCSARRISARTRASTSRRSKLTTLERAALRRPAQRRRRSRSASASRASSTSPASSSTASRSTNTPATGKRSSRSTSRTITSSRSIPGSAISSTSATSSGNSATGTACRRAA